MRLYCIYVTFLAGEYEALFTGIVGTSIAYTFGDVLDMGFEPRMRPLDTADGLGSELYLRIGIIVIGLHLGQKLTRRV